MAAQANIGLGAEFGSEIAGFTVDGTAGFDRLPGITEEQDRRYYAITVKPTVFINLVPDHIIFHRMFPMSAIADHRRMRLALHRRCGVAPDATCRTRSSCSTGSTSRTSRRASELSPSMSSRAYRNGGVLVPAEHHIAEFHEWVVSRLGA